MTLTNTILNGWPEQRKKKCHLSIVDFKNHRHELTIINGYRIVFRGQSFKPKSKEEGKDQESNLSSTPNPKHRMGKWQKHKKTPHTRKRRGQHFPNRWHTAAKTDIPVRQKQTQITKKIHRRNITVEPSVRKKNLTSFTVPTSQRIWIKAYRGLVCMKYPNLCLTHLLVHMNQYINMR